MCVHCVVAELLVKHPRPELMCPLGVTRVYLDSNVGDVLGIRYAFLVCVNFEGKSGVEILPWVVVDADRFRARIGTILGLALRREGDSTIFIGAIHVSPRSWKRTRREATGWSTMLPPGPS